jgi:hypothetical protein
LIYYTSLKKSILRKIKKLLPEITPREILLDDFMRRMGIYASAIFFDTALF